MSKVQLERSRGLQARQELPRVALEVGTGRRRDRLAGDEPLAERGHERAVARDAVVEVGPRREPGGADIAGDLLLSDAHTGPEPFADPGGMVVLGLVARPMPEMDLDAVATVPSGMDDDAVRDGAHRRADRRSVVDRKMGTHPAEDRVRPRVGEARGDAGELERRLEEALPERLAGQVVVSVARRPLEPHAGERLAPARVLGDEDPAVVDEVVARVALLDQETKAVPGARVGGEVEVRGENLDQVEHEPRRLAGPLDRVEQRALHCAAHDLDPNLGDGLGPSDAPAAVRRTGGAGEPRARFVADLDRLVPKIPGALDRGARTGSSHGRARSPERRE